MKLFIIITTSVLTFSEPVYAYIDPGTGSYIFQLAIAGFLGSLFFLKSSWRRLITFFNDLKRNVNGYKKE